MNAVVPLRQGPDTMATVAPPHNLEAERAVLGAVLLSDKALRPLILEERLRPEHFYRDLHRLVWQAMTALSDQGDPVDVLTVTAHLKSIGMLESAGGTAAIDELTGSVPGLGGVRQYARIIVDHYRWRQRLSSAYQQVAVILNHAGEQEYEQALRAATELVALQDDETFVDPDDLTGHMWRWIDQPPDPGLPIPPELTGLGKMIRLRSGHVTVIAGWSHHGKTLVASQLAAWIGHKGNRSVIWTNEDTPEELVARHYQRALAVPASAISDRNITPDQAQKIVGYGRLPFGVQPCFSWDATQIARHIRQVRPNLAVVDHFHALPGVSKTDGIDDAMQTLVAAAGQTPCHLIVVCQLNQERNKSVVRPAPVGRDLRGSGQLYALAHTVLLVHRQEEEALDPTTSRPLGRAIQLDEGTLDIVKNKPTGRLGATAVLFDQKRLRFVEATTR